MTLARAAWRDIGTNVELLVADGPLEPARAAVAVLIARVDAAYSRFREDSELNRAQRRGGRPVTVSALLARAIDVALGAARATDGLVDPTVGRALRLAGYDRDFALLADRPIAPVIAVESVPGWQVIDWQPSARRLAVPAGVELDLGAVGKALAVDLAAEAAQAALPASAGLVLGIGGDIRACGRALHGGWRIRLADDSTVAPDTEGELAIISDGAVATSSTLVRRWHAGDVTFHHLIDPRTGGPVSSPWLTVTAFAPTCVEANTLSTAALILGDGAAEWLAGRGASARLVGVDGSIVHVGDWTDAEAA